MQHTTAVILHQDRFLLKETLNEIAKIFKQAMQWDRSQPIQALKNDVGLFRYLFAHAMPFSRGSAAVAEWIEKLIYRAHHFDCQHATHTMGDLEAFVAPLWPTFQNNAYDATLSLVDRVTSLMRLFICPQFFYPSSLQSELLGGMIIGQVQAMEI